MNVAVYWNLHKLTWSVQSRERENYGLVIAHSDTVLLRNAVPRVRETGRKRVVETRSKIVHAFICGELVGYAGEPEQETLTPVRVSYNPYKYPTFYYVGSEYPFTEQTDYAFLNNGKVFINAV